MPATTNPEDRARSEYERIVLLVQPLLLHRALRLTGNREEASDLVQSTLERGYRAFDRFRPGTSAASWLCTIMTNHFIDELRRHRLMRYAKPIDQLEIAAPPAEAPPAWRNLLDEQVREAAARLPAYCRLPFELHAFEHMSYRDIATRLGLRVNTVCSRIHRARGYLRRLLLAELAN
jgi:RNA polymerase sigma-70 factor (ECF subfamily)